jgi:hypothetical protein
MEEYAEKEAENPKIQGEFYKCISCQTFYFFLSFLSKDFRVID